MEYGSLFNEMMASSEQPVPSVGDGATMLRWTDRHAATVIAVSGDGKTVTVQRDRAMRTDDNGMSESQTYHYAPDSLGETAVYTRRSNGRYVQQDLTDREHRAALVIGVRAEYRDYSF
jgi:hypothetical protein